MIRQAIKTIVPNRVVKAIRKAWPARDYNNHHVDEASKLVDIKRASVLVVGANTGGDCKHFLKRGFPDVHGLDVVDNIGADFKNERVTYHKVSIEDCGLPSESFDLVFSFATMEHVPNVMAGFSEMVRLVKPGGVLYSVASPLWNSPYGHHMGCFNGHPWVHLAYDRAGILEYGARHNITGERGYPLDQIVDYMLDPRFFNMLPAAAYRAATANFPDFEVMANRLDRESVGLLEHPLAALSMKKGFSEEELLSVTHYLIARKTGR